MLNMKLENICEWYVMASSMNIIEGDMKRCYYECDGFNKKCQNYVPKSQRLKKVMRILHKYRLDEPEEDETL